MSFREDYKVRELTEVEKVAVLLTEGPFICMVQDPRCKTKRCCFLCNNGKLIIDLPEYPYPDRKGMACAYQPKNPKWCQGCNVLHNILEDFNINIRK
jgi:hypothetical protein